VRALSDGGLHRNAGIVATIALAVWAADELIRGVNPFRRVLGAVVLVGIVLP
jgi:type IV secretory pathway VirB2 component (pilin)